MAAPPNLSGKLPLRSPPPTELPRIMYGTAYKSERTADLVYDAIEAGFRALDTANYPRAYDEPRTGEGIRRAIADGIVSRKDLFVQTKFTPVSQHDERIPYDPSLPIPEQVRASLRSSLEHLATPDVDSPYLDAVLLHLPYPDDEDNLAVWKTLQEFVPHAIRHVGISNTSLRVLQLLENESSGSGEKPPAAVPAIVSNKFSDDTDYDVAVRAFCRDHDIVYQSFFVLTANGHLLRSEPVERVARGAGVEAVGALYALVMGLGGLQMLDGTTSGVHMAQDLAMPRKVDEWAEGGEGKREWDACLAGFKKLIGE